MYIYNICGIAGNNGNPQMYMCNVILLGEQTNPFAQQDISRYTFFKEATVLESPSLDISRRSSFMK